MSQRQPETHANLRAAKLSGDVATIARIAVSNEAWNSLSQRAKGRSKRDENMVAAVQHACNENRASWHASTAALLCPQRMRVSSTHCTRSMRCIRSMRCASAKPPELFHKRAGSQGES
jgi:dissimilatory sulfite reductase (desulfoviridin) alpha/beta subunit